MFVRDAQLVLRDLQAVLNAETGFGGLVTDNGSRCLEKFLHVLAQHFDIFNEFIAGGPRIWI
jgi:hypothetical protein